MGSLDISWGWGWVRGWETRVFGQAKPPWSGLGEGVVLYRVTSLFGRGSCQPSPHPPALTPSVALFPGSSAAPPSSFYSPLPSPWLYPNPKTPFSSCKKPSCPPHLPAAAVRTALAAAKSALLFSTSLFLPSSAADPSPSIGGWVSAARTLVTTSQSRWILCNPGWEGPAAAGSVRGAGTRT